jgi:prepilin signal peptidase PulO-like enzyme (type II secretory pathway)
LLFLKFGLTIDTLFLWAMSATMIVLAGTDIKEKVVFDIHTYILAGLGILYAIYVTSMYIYQVHAVGANFELNKFFLLHNPVTSAILGMALGIAILEIFARAGYLIAGTRAFGEGDTLIAAGLGAIFGWKMLLIVLILSVIIQVLIFLPIFIKGLVVDKEWKTFSAFVSFVLYAFVFYALQLLHVIDANNVVLYSICALVLAILGIASCVFIFKGLKEKPEKRTYLPFGPAMVAAALIILMF